jgi:hypothetical protein
MECPEQEEVFLVQENLSILNLVVYILEKLIYYLKMVLNLILIQ